MFVKGLAEIHARLYTDTCEIMRSSNVKRENGTSTKEYKAIAEDVPCRLSQPAKNEKAQGAPEPTFEAHAKLFCALDVDIMAGDRVIVSRNEELREYEAGESFSYSAHKEVALYRRGNA